MAEMMYLKSSANFEPQMASFEPPVASFGMALALLLAELNSLAAVVDVKVYDDLVDTRRRCIDVE